MPDLASIARPPSPLTEGKLERMPGYSRRQAPLGSIDNKDGQFTYSNLEDLETTEHSTLASRSSKVQMVNMAADTINAFSPGRPVTFISVGSGHLLSEELIHRQLSEEKKKDIRWRCIDPIYLPHGISHGIFTKGKNARIQFGKNKDAKAFSSSQAYLSKQEHGESIADGDKKSDVVVFVNDPPSILPKDYERMSALLREEGFLIRGKTIEENEIKKANAILLTVAPNEQKYTQQLKGLSEDLSRGGITFSANMIKCLPQSDGTYEYIAGGNVSKTLQEKVKQQVSYTSERLPKDKAPIEKLNTGIEICIEGIGKANKDIIAVKTIFSDFDRSVEQVVQHFSNANGSVVLAKLENNETSITKIKS